MRLAAFVVSLCACGRLQFDSAPADGSLEVDAGAPRPVGWRLIPEGPLPPTLWTRAAWTGTELVVFGGAVDFDYNATDVGARFDPATATWTSMNAVGAPTARHTPLIASASGYVFVYGGATEYDSLAGGALYEVATDTWSPISDGPAGIRIYSALHAVGDSFLLWGGFQGGSANHSQTGFLYNPVTDAWTAMSTVGAPSARTFPASVWTGDRLIVWGGCSGGMPSCGTLHGTGAIYDPVLDTWTPMSTDNAPVARAQHTAVWTGSEMIIFGGVTAGDETGHVNTGAIYSPATDSWRPITTTGAPAPRGDPAAAWLGTKMLIWGSSLGAMDGALYDPVLDTWEPITTVGAPVGRQRFAHVTDGDRLLVFGGSITSATGGIYTPANP